MELSLPSIDPSSPSTPQCWRGLFENKNALNVNTQEGTNKQTMLLQADGGGHQWDFHNIGSQCADNPKCTGLPPQGALQWGGDH